MNAPAQTYVVETPGGTPITYHGIVDVQVSPLGHLVLISLVGIAAIYTPNMWLTLERRDP